jgi:hypothetical protein
MRRDSQHFFKRIPGAAVLGMCLMLGACALNPSSHRNSQSVVAVVHRTGGFVAGDELITYYSGGAFDQLRQDGPAKGKHASGVLPPDSWSALQRSLAAVDDLTVLEYAPPPGAADYHLFELQRRGRTVKWTDLSPQLPAALSQISIVFNLTEMLGDAAAKR